MSKDKLLHWVRESQQYAAILAEAFLFIALVVSSIDASMGGALTSITAIKWGWAIVLALGLDTCFMAAWVRCAVDRRRALLWNLPLAVGMSVIVFLPVSIQMLQQSLDITFSQALSNLGINLVFMTYARSFVVVLLGAVLALTNVEQPVKHVKQTMKQEIPLETESSQQTMTITEKPVPQLAAPVSSETPDETPETANETEVKQSLVERIEALLQDMPDVSSRDAAVLLEAPHSTVYRQMKQLKQK